MDLCIWLPGRLWVRWLIPVWARAQLRGVVAESGPLRYVVQRQGGAIPQHSILYRGPIASTARRLGYVLVPLWLLAQSCLPMGHCCTSWVNRLVARGISWWMALGLTTVRALHPLIDAFTPIISAPEAAILGVGRIRSSAMPRGVKIVAREIVALSLAFDQHLVDGAPAARFLRRIEQLIANPPVLRR